MPARDIIHDAVRNALIKDGWTITADPYVIAYEDLTLYADLAADKLLAAQREGESIAVEAKSFIGKSAIRDLEQALGQYELYRRLIRRTEPVRRLYLAVTDEVYEDVLQSRAISEVIEEMQVPLLVVDPDREEIVRWERPNDTANS